MVEVQSVDPTFHHVKLTAPLPVNVCNDTFEYCMPLSPMLSYKSSAEGFWLPDIADVSGKIPVETADALTAFGWLLGAGLTNRAHMGFAPARLLLSQLWPTCSPDLGVAFQPTEFDLLLHDEGLHQVCEIQDGCREIVALLMMNLLCRQSLRGIKTMDIKSFKSLLAAEDMASSTSTADYCKHMMNSVLVEPFEQQLVCLRSGFHQALGRPGLDILRRYDVTCDDLQELVLLFRDDNIMIFGLCLECEVSLALCSCSVSLC